MYSHRNGAVSGIMGDEKLMGSVVSILRLPVQTQQIKTKGRPDTKGHVLLIKLLMRLVTN